MVINRGALLVKVVRPVFSIYFMIGKYLIFDWKIFIFVFSENKPVFVWTFKILFLSLHQRFKYSINVGVITKNKRKMKQIALKFTFILRDEKFDNLLSNNGLLSCNQCSSVTGRCGRNKLIL